MPRCHWHLTYEGRPLKDNKQLQSYGISAESTIQLAFRLLGGKGGFGSLLRGAGRAILTDNVDACRDLSGRRIRHANAEKRLAQWAAEAKERELEKIAMKHVQEQQKANKREERAQVWSGSTMPAMVYQHPPGRLLFCMSSLAQECAYHRIWQHC